MDGLMQTNRSCIRNISILAHVDHGKTSLADSLVASNGIIPQRQAGKLRYMDSRKDEQERGITMKSSAISLHYKQGDEAYLINLIDSPGHVDFSSEVSTAVRLSDGALLVIDVVEGLCSQTRVVLQQAWEEGITLCLVLNKIDRLIIELQQTPTEAYYHLQKVLEQVNAVTGSLFTSKIMEAASRKEEDSLSHTCPPPAKTGEVTYDWSIQLEDIDDSALYFSPEKGNVVFVSALDGWGFSVSDFASMYANKLGLKSEVLQRTLWGDFFLSAKTKRIFKGAQAKGKKPIFVQFVLENIWEVYKSVLIDRNKDRIEKIVKSLNLKISARDSRHTNPKVHLFSLCSQWLPLAKTVLDMVVSKLPSPLELTEERVEKLMCGASRTFSSLPLRSQLLKNDFLSCSVEESSPILIFVSKLFVVDKMAFPQHQNRSLTTAEIAERSLIARQRHHAKMAAMDGVREEATSSPEASSCTSADKKLVTQEEEVQAKPEAALSSTILLAFSRVFSGVVKKGQELYVLQPRYDLREAILEGQMGLLPPHVCKFTVEGLYTLVGRSVLPVESVSAGNIVGIAGLEESIVKSGTISSTLACPAFSTMVAVASPIVRVAIEPLHVSDLPALVSGMKLLNQVDPSVKVYVQDTGEHVLAAAGEVHLQKCLDDLEKQYACVKLNVSEPIIPFRETVVIPPKVDMVNEDISVENEFKFVTQAHGEASFPLSSGVEERDKPASTSTEIRIQTSNKACSLLLEAQPLPAECVRILEGNPLLLKALNLVQSSASKKDMVLNSETLAELKELKTKLNFALQPLESELEINELVDRIWCFGPRNTGPNMLLNAGENYSRLSLWQAIESNPSICEVPLLEFGNSIVSGFQLATLSGPLCEEPMHGVCILVKEWSYTTTEDQLSRNKESTILESLHSASYSPNSAVPLKGPATYGPFSGQLISAMKEGCRRAYLAQPARLMSAMYTSNILATAEVLGKVYSVLGRRNGRVLSEDLIGSSIFSIQALLPVAESFGFAEEMRKRTSGFANPQLIFSHWEVIPSNPFWVPSTDEELLHFGEKADYDNIARKYMNSVRKKKGLLVDEKIIEHGEKQRTLKKNK